MVALLDWGLFLPRDALPGAVRQLLAVLSPVISSVGLAVSVVVPVVVPAVEATILLLAVVVLEPVGYPLVLNAIGV